jgi:type I restriction enzyme S subunit
VSIALKPYPECKDSGVPWLGEIPAHWSIGPGFSAFREKKAKNTGMPESQVLSLSYGKIVIKPPEKLHGLVPASFETYQIVDPDDIIVRPTDLQNDWTSLRVGLARNRGIITSAYLCLQTVEPTIPEYGYLLLHAYDLKKIFYGMGSGLRQNLDFSDLKRMSVLIPPVEEQIAIARFLDHYDHLTRRYIRAQRRLIDLLEEQKQVLIQQAVTRGLDPNVPLKDSGIEWLGKIPAHWEVWQIGHLSKVGNGSTPSRGNSRYWTEDGYPWLNSSSVNQGVITQAYQFVTPLALQECHLPIVPQDSVLVAITGQGKTRGTAALLKFEATINQHLAFVTPREPCLSPEYLQLFLIGAYRQLRAISESSGSTKGALTCTDLKHFRVTVPPRSEQDSIIASIREHTVHVDTAVEGARCQIDLVREYRTRLIADVVTGKLDVRDVAPEALLPDLDEAGDLGDLDDLEEDAKLNDLDTEELNDADD